jgi:hypothetical protein
MASQESLQVRQYLMTAKASQTAGTDIAIGGYNFFSR